MVSRSLRGGRVTWVLLTLIAMTGAGCNSRVDRDERLVEATRRAMEQQAKQNDVIAGQAESVVEQSREVAEAAKELVTHDAEARREMIQASQKLNSELHTERLSVNRQIEKLDEERKRIADHRHRDPVIATAIEGLGLMLACLLPLVVCVLVLWQLRDGTDDEKALGEMLTMELMSENPVLLNAPVYRRLESTEPRTELPRPPATEPADGMEEPPF